MRYDTMRKHEQLAASWLHKWNIIELQSQIDLSGVGGDQNRAKRTVNISLTFVRALETRLQMMMMLPCLLSFLICNCLPTHLLYKVIMYEYILCRQFVPLA